MQNWLGARGWWIQMSSWEGKELVFNIVFITGIDNFQLLSILVGQKGDFLTSPREEGGK